MYDDVVREACRLPTEMHLPAFTESHSGRSTSKSGVQGSSSHSWLKDFLSWTGLTTAGLTRGRTHPKKEHAPQSLRDVESRRGEHRGTSRGVIVMLMRGDDGPAL